MWPCYEGRWLVILKVWSLICMTGHRWTNNISVHFWIKHARDEQQPPPHPPTPPTRSTSFGRVLWKIWDENVQRRQRRRAQHMGAYRIRCHSAVHHLHQCIHPNKHHTYISENKTRDIWKWTSAMRIRKGCIGHYITIIIMIRKNCNIEISWWKSRVFAKQMSKKKNKWMV